ncbi:MAG TPA: YciI family protein [Steroidobacteraceae bacterium]|nr:YciI family protein [Steroidobacteraceae bacterium]
MNGKVITSVVIAILAFTILPLEPLAGQEAEARKQFVYRLQLAPQFHEEAAWTDVENAVVAEHFEHLAQAAKSGQVILAGRTMEPLDKTFGLVIFEADSETAAAEFMRSDPAVKAGLMTATLHPYAVALQRE